MVEVLEEPIAFCDAGRLGVSAAHGAGEDQPDQ